jgi:hypothetical protein
MLYKIADRSLSGRHHFFFGLKNKSWGSTVLNGIQ